MLLKAFIRPKPLVESLAAPAIPVENLINLGNSPHNLQLCRRWVFGQNEFAKVIQMLGLVVRDRNATTADAADSLSGVVGECSKHRVDLAEPPKVGFLNVVHHWADSTNLSSIRNANAFSSLF
jgi:hypothetical protein